MAEQKGRRPTDKTVAAFTDQDDQLLAKLAVKHECVRMAQVHEAFAYQQEQRQQGVSVGLDEVFLSKGMISRKQLETLSLARTFLKQRQPERILSKVAIGNGFVSKDQVEGAMQQQVQLFKETKTFKPLIDIWVDSGVLSSEQSAALLAAVEEIDRPKPASQGSGPTDAGEESAEGARPVRSDADELGSAAEQQQEVTDGSEADFRITVSADGLEAYLRLDGNTRNQVDLPDVKALLAATGITYGVVDDALIEAFLAESNRLGKPFKIAQGEPPKRGRDAELKYLFGEELLRSGTVDERGRIDFKDRGRIPLVNQGDVIAEKIPKIEEVSGIDVYGREIGVEKSIDRQFLCGAGTSISDDRLQVVAKVSGKPQLSPIGKISVLSEMHIRGDVDLETGNVHFNGLVNVRGVVQDGFQVTGGSLEAEEISKASIDVTGDVLVRGGILGASIRAGGSVTASHIHGARVEAMGDVCVSNGVVDSEIDTAGRCQVGGGAILSSKVSARQGIDAAQIGSESSTPCALTIGTDSLGRQELEQAQSRLHAKQSEKAKHLQNIAELEGQLPEVELKIGELVQVQDRGSVERKDLEKDLQTAAKLNSQPQIVQLEEAMRQIDTEIEAAEKELEAHFDRQDALKQEISDHRDAITAIDQEIETFTHELTALTNWLEQVRERAGVKVHNVIHQDTMIRGDFTSVILRADREKVFIRESKNLHDATEAAESGTHRMEIIGLV